MKNRLLKNVILFFILTAVLVSGLAVSKQALIYTSAAQKKGGEDQNYYFHSLSDLNGKRIGVQTGTSFDVSVREKLPEAKLEYFNGKADLMAALSGNKIDAFVVDEVVAEIFLRESNQVTYLSEFLDSYDFAPIFARTKEGEKLRDEFNDFLEQLPEGTLDQLADKWFSEDESEKTMPDISELNNENGTLRLATESGYAPFEYVRNGKVVGYDMEIAAMFCEYGGYGLEIVDMNFDGILPAVQTGKCDFAAAGISIIPERAESVLFSEPNFSGGTVMVIRTENAGENSSVGTGDTDNAMTDSGAAAEEAKKDASLWDNVRESFDKTFIRENRWRLFEKGILTTLVITLLSVLFGTAFGFCIFMMCRNGNPIANIVTRFFMWLVQGMPMVVLLMILYYIIFGSVAVNGVIVAVVGFTLTFGTSVFGLLKIGVGAVGIGQYEAAYALGYSNRQTFYKIILPQAMPHVLPSYSGEIVNLIKSTAIVGYIAVQDLTKIGDIVRSRTYEAFFPLIAITIIYFLLEALAGFLVGRISINFNPKRRKESEILKGITHR
ncbi:MAG: transporter substrate-binding domain-containing protein [Butyrivibrio sp.]|nr:transporter substrate-binding domain-containing protein [Butyrivibrio sp.]